MDFITAHTPEFSAGVIVAAIVCTLLDLFVVSGLNRARKGHLRAEAHYDERAEALLNVEPEKPIASFTTRREERQGRFVPIGSDAS